MTVEVIKWLDSGLSIADGWQTIEFYREAGRLDRMYAYTVGMVFHEDEDVVLVAQTYDPKHDTYINAQAIAKANITDRTVVDETELS